MIWTGWISHSLGHGGAGGDWIDAYDMGLVIGIKQTDWFWSREYLLELIRIYISKVWNPFKPYSINEWL